VQDLLAVAARPNWEYVRAKLREIDDDVSAAVLTAFSVDQIEDFRREAAHAIERHRGRVDDEASRMPRCGSPCNGRAKSWVCRA
jgi:hypothetical protein